MIFLATPVPFNTGLTGEQIQTAFNNALKFDEIQAQITALEVRIKALEDAQTTETPTEEATK